MSDFRKALRDAIGGVEAPEAPKEEGASGRVAKRLRENIVWPERSVEVQRERLRKEVRDEAAGAEEAD